VSEDAVKIALWGAPGSGKTAYLGALAISVEMEEIHDGGRAPRPRAGSWKINALPGPSWEYLYTLKSQMQDGKFPDSTAYGANHPLIWSFAGNLAGSEFDKRLWPLRRRDRPVNFTIELKDIAGGAFDRSPSGMPGVRNAASIEAIEHLADADGIIYFFDPIAARDSQEAIRYVGETMDRLRSLVYGKTGKSEELLSQHVSVCVTKFDHREMYRRARKLGFVYSGPDGFPVIPDTYAKRLFESICSGDFWDSRSEEKREEAMGLRRKFNNNFWHDRIKYYATSAIGFTTNDPDAKFNADRFQPNYGAANTIIGDVHPINVLEPLIRLQQRIARERRG
jgi:hypothetical protein